MLLSFCLQNASKESEVWDQIFCFLCTFKVLPESGVQRSSLAGLMGWVPPPLFLDPSPSPFVPGPLPLQPQDTCHPPGPPSLPTCDPHTQLLRADTSLQTLLLKPYNPISTHPSQAVLSCTVGHAGQACTLAGTLPCTLPCTYVPM